MIARRMLMMACLSAAFAAAPHAQTFPDSQAMTEFQRALDAYAFSHRQVERRAGESAGAGKMASGMRAARPSPQDGDIFTPLVASVFRTRINRAEKSGCVTIATPESFVVPRPNQGASGTAALPACMTAVLPKLPPELEYRSAGVVLLLVDTHANLVVDVLHGAFPAP